ncbi:MAG TPA: transporter substrate-binding domain-containing protein [Candidatus Marinimicrobia bacterium]|nr:transporter substrate-binding domain-containing protein [Candidatus Neomarinimicrobiota bacterium]
MLCLVSILLFLVACPKKELKVQNNNESTLSLSGASISWGNEEPDTMRATLALQVSNPTVKIDLPEIREYGKLKVVLVYSATSYFLYKGEPMGYEYELLRRLANDLTLELEIVMAKDINEVFEMLNDGRGDLVAHGLTITRKRAQLVQFTVHHSLTKQVLVQRKPDNWRKMKLHEIEASLIRDAVNLIGEKVYVRQNTSYYTRLMNLMDEIGGDIQVEIVSGTVSTEELIRQVAEGQIEYTISDDHIALINAAYYPVLDVDTPISFSQRLAWAVRKNSPLLLESVNTWIDSMKKETDYYVIYNKYFKNTLAFRSRQRSDFFVNRDTGQISPYDSLIRAQAQELEWDWRLFASLIYQESMFNPKSESWAGAKGLMQLMPGTARQYGVTDRSDPVQSIRAGTQYLHDLHDAWYKTLGDSLEAIKFAMASYNAGQEHVKDARRLAEKFGKNPNIWYEHVENEILKLSDKKYYNDIVVLRGYCRGEEPYKYVREIFDRYEQYKQFVEK